MMARFTGEPPDAATLRGLVDSGLTDREIGDHYGAVPTAVAYWRKRHGISKSRPARLDHRASGAVPWELNVSAGHHNDGLVRLLRARDRMAHGMSVPVKQARQVENLEATLAEPAEGAPHGLVLDYDFKVGFRTLARDPAIDDPDGVVRMPHKSD